MRSINPLRNDHLLCGTRNPFWLWCDHPEKWQRQISRWQSSGFPCGRWGTYSQAKLNKRFDSLWAMNAINVIGLLRNSCRRWFSKCAERIWQLIPITSKLVTVWELSTSSCRLVTVKTLRSLNRCAAFLFHFAQNSGMIPLSPNYWSRETDVWKCFESIKNETRCWMGLFGGN
jgi:hypothetical protein